MTTLTPRQLEVLEAYARTGDQRVAAASLGISLQTAKNHLGHTYRKLGVTNAIEAMGARGWIVIPEGAVR